MKENQTPTPARRRIGLEVPSPLRLRRLTAGVALSDAARIAGISLTAASFAERGIGRTAIEDAQRLDRAVKKLAAAVRP
jgi:hypothetical protein